MTPQVMADYEIVPGTIYLIDVLENDSGLAHARSRSKNVLLVPQPSEDPYDPLVHNFRMLFAGVTGNAD
jgi:hypothetical protein